jgi:hypothetical protein
MITKMSLGIIFFILAQPGLHAVEQPVPIPEGMHSYFAVQTLERKAQSLLFRFRHVSPTGSINDKAYGSKISIRLVGDGKIIEKSEKILHSVVDKEIMQRQEFEQKPAFEVVNTYVFLESDDLVNAKKVVISESGLTVEIDLKGNGDKQ